VTGPGTVSISRNEDLSVGSQLFAVTATDGDKAVSNNHKDHRLIYSISHLKMNVLTQLLKISWLLWYEAIFNSKFWLIITHFNNNQMMITMLID